MPHPSAFSVPRWQAALLGLLLTAASMRLGALAVWRDEIASTRLYLLYQGATLGFNYFEFGAVRRGLGSSIVHLLSGDMIVATAAFHVLSALAVAAVAAWLFRRAEVRGLGRITLALVMLALMLRWSEDPGRADMAVAALLGAATIAMQRRRPVVACACVCIGLFVHEASFIFGLPLLAALALRQGGRDAFTRRAFTIAFTRRAGPDAFTPHAPPDALTRRAGIGVAAVFAATLAVYFALPLLPHADTATMVAGVRAKFPPSEYVEWAIYFAVSGLRGVRTSLCQNAIDPTYGVHVAGGVAVLLLIWLALEPHPRRGWATAALAAVPPFAFLFVVANDMARWTVLAGFNLWLLQAAMPARGTGGGERGGAARGALDEHEAQVRCARDAARRAGWRLAFALALFPLTLARFGLVPLRIYAPSPTIEWIARVLGGPATPHITTVLERCDPGWRSVLDAPAAR